MFKNKGVPRFFRLIGVGLFFLILIRLDMGKLAEAARSVPLQSLVLIVLLSVAIVVVKSLRWFVFVRQQDISLAFPDVLRIYCIGNYLGSISPGRLGELSRVFYIKMKTEHCDTIGAVVSVVADRMLDVLMLFVVAVVGTAVVFSGSTIMSVSAVLSVGIVVFCVYAARRKGVAFLVSVVNFAVSKCVKGQSALQSEDVLKILRKLKKRSIWEALGWHILAWGLFYLLISVIAGACGIWIGFWALAVATSAAMILSMLPITVAGVGIRDLTIISFFAKAGISQELAVLYSFMHLSVFLFIPALIGFVYFVSSNQKKDSNIEKEPVDG